MEELSAEEPRTRASPLRPPRQGGGVQGPHGCTAKTTTTSSTTTCTRAETGTAAVTQRDILRRDPYVSGTGSRDTNDKPQVPAVYKCAQGNVDGCGSLGRGTASGSRTVPSITEPGSPSPAAKNIAAGDRGVVLDDVDPVANSTTEPGGGGRQGAHGGTAEPGTDAHFRNLFRNQGPEKGSEFVGKRVAVHGMQASAKRTKQGPEAVETAEETETAERHGGQSEREGLEPDGWTIVRPRGRRGAAPVGGGASSVPGACKRKRPVEMEGRAVWWRKVHQWDPRISRIKVECRSRRPQAVI